MPILSRLRPLNQRNSAPAEVYPLPQPPSDAANPTVPDSDDTILSHHYVLMAQDTKSSVSSTCRWFDLGDLELTGTRPIAAGGFADIWEANLDGRKAILKSYRCYVVFNDSQVFERFHNEVRVGCILLNHGGANAVPFVGVYSTEAHPFGLVYEYMVGLDLRQYLRSEPGAQKLKLLTETARGLRVMHDLEIVHGCLSTANILVDKDGVPHIAGLGNAHALHDPTGSTANTGMSTGFKSPTKPDDICAFGAMAFEILTGLRPFSDSTKTAANTSMLRGDRPTRPNNPRVSNALWSMIERSWHKDASKRLSIGDVASILENESCS